MLRAVPPALVGILMLVVWEGVCRAAHVPPYLFPTPSEIAIRFVQQWTVLVHALSATLVVTFQAFLISVILGTLIAFLFVQSKVIEMCLFPYAVFAQMTLIAAVGSAHHPPDQEHGFVADHLRDGNRDLSDHLEYDHRLTQRRSRAAQLLPDEQVDAIRDLDALAHSQRVSSGMALIGAVVAEFVAGTGGWSAGLAYRILQAGFQLDIPLMFAALLLIAMTGVVLYALMVALTKTLLGHWHESEMAEEV
jgi:NitT/TauT family transport system permease protein